MLVSICEGTNRHSSSLAEGREVHRPAGIFTGIPYDLYRRAAGGRGLLIKSEDDHFRHLRNDYLPHFNRHTDDYLQYLPAAVMLGMKLGGVEGRSSWGRMLASDAFSALLMGSVVFSLKQTTHVMRHDGSNDHSFPSGHTATAFMTATMLAKEYGHKSPWIGIGAYSVATATGLMRMANNKHWLSDVLTGAGIGILSTELGYYLTDLIFKEKGIRRFTDNEAFGHKDKPSFFGLYIGMNIPLSGYDIDEQHEFSTSSGSTVWRGRGSSALTSGWAGALRLPTRRSLCTTRKWRETRSMRYHSVRAAISPILCPLVSK